MAVALWVSTLAYTPVNARNGRLGPLNRPGLNGITDVTNGLLVSPGDGNLVGTVGGINRGVLNGDGITGLVHLRPQYGDHAGVVPEKPRLGGIKRGATLCTHLLKHRLESVVLAHSTTEDELVRAGYR